ncbi:calcium and integrin-binding protein 1-like isoform X4 [Leptopilina heterotoma]|uniref:calcium and integrin-binding protein 1-like isoform X4 n=1 Tax=Leptopilina heterotoma TaxID=63436 RepID=UPI001CA7BB94|nr:calcium and integrin-binding protein 1-like isoform X4 [Leptopilina heterotoma]
MRFSTRILPLETKKHFTQNCIFYSFLSFSRFPHNPFRDSIFRVFSSKRDGKMGFEDLLDLCSALNEKCPESVRSSWAFRIFDFDGDNQISLDDLIESVGRLTGLENGDSRIDRESAEFIAQLALEELDIVQSGCISQQEFVHNISKMPDFSHTFQLMP